MNSIRLVLLPVAVAVLAGCAYQKSVQVDAAAADKDIAAVRNPLVAQIRDSERVRIAAQDVQRPFIAGNQEPLAREIKMPAALRRSVPITANFQRGSVDLQTALNQVAEASGLIITATPDALLPPSMFAPRMASKEAPILAPSRVQLQASNVPLWQLLDDIARQADVSWRPVATGAEFYRVETKIFHLAAIPQIATTTATLGRNGGSNNVFESQSKTGFTSKDQNLITGMKETIDALLSTSGKAVISQESQTLVVTDTAPALARISRYVEDQNKLMSRRVRVLIESIEVTTKDDNDYGMDWNLIYKAANSAISVASPASLVATQVGTTGWARSTGKLSGSDAVVQALNEVGTVVSRRSFPFTTTSGRPVTQAIRTTFNYVDQVQATAVSSSIISTSAQAPTVTQKEETVGTFVTLVPTAKADGTIFLSVSFDVTSAQPLKAFTVGSGDSAVTVQQKTIDGQGVIQEVPVRSGQTVVIGGIESNSNSVTSRRLGANLPLLMGGSDQGRHTKSRMVLLVTAIAEEGV
ncbi:type II secretion system protein GspD [Variovorax sp. LjRoot178]|uniref:type II secretion system protein GspD n=1 Tax=Variovorax sp. LjRoot178 TaxID=3342277 RepID=UPI003ECE22A9